MGETMTEATNENLQILLTKLMGDRFCSGEISDVDACIQNFVPQSSDGSWIDRSLQRRGMKKCEPYQDAARRCMDDEKKQKSVFKAAAAFPSCREERKTLEMCRLHGKSDCEQEALDVLFCGMVGLVQKLREKQNHRQ
uniref:Uncharacterized protein n=1 Tax=Trypanosoma congolense (strain IL3000) TaxID=1068625 RepID=G0UJF4_TRYCI|nr:conserved hypothetical protein [Trypanosoma congolense IL3000]